ncbi:hypothetical protein KAS08_01470 [Candidatus Pacearchaeota archaeon]|nr:hypothetical protein [Candidatus Pacearchaeota archaeon]
MNIQDILKDELNKISLSIEDVSKLRNISNDFVKLLKTKKVHARIGGSLAKGTLIKKDSKQDVDIFVIFDYSEDISKLEKILKNLKLPGTLKKVHGSRDYFQINCKDAILEIIPVIKNSDPELAENVTDVSLSHVKYIGAEVKKNPSIADEIKLAKAFCRANRYYGAESYIHGFSGYSLEILVIYFGSFVKFLKKIQRAKVIDPLKYFKGEHEVLRELNHSKLNCPLVVIDPTYKYRNVTAGLGMETFVKFLDTAKEFLKNPTGEFFKKKEIDIQGLKSFAEKSKAVFIEMDLSTNRQEGDIAGTKMKKILDFFSEELARKKQIILKKEFDYFGKQKAKGYLVVEEKTEVEFRGPELGLEIPIKAFKKAKGDRVFKKKGYYWYKEKTSIKEISKLLKKVETEMGANLTIIN